MYVRAFIAHKQHAVAIARLPHWQVDQYQQPIFSMTHIIGRCPIGPLDAYFRKKKQQY